MAGDETLAAAAAILQGFAVDPAITSNNNANTAPSSSSSSSFFSSLSSTSVPSLDFLSSTSSRSTNGCDQKTPKLPGDHSPAKAAFEHELGALVRRVRHLESNVSSSLSFSPLPPLLFGLFSFPNIDSKTAAISTTPSKS